MRLPKTNEVVEQEKKRSELKKKFLQDNMQEIIYGNHMTRERRDYVEEKIGMTIRCVRKLYASHKIEIVQTGGEPINKA